MITPVQAHGTPPAPGSVSIEITAPIGVGGLGEVSATVGSSPST